MDHDAYRTYDASTKDPVSVEVDRWPPPYHHQQRNDFLELPVVSDGSSGQYQDQDLLFGGSKNVDMKGIGPSLHLFGLNCFVHSRCSCSERYH